MEQTMYTKNGKEFKVPANIVPAAQWWANAIRSPKFNNGDTSRNGDIGAMLASLLNAGTPVTVAQADAFELALVEILMEDVQTYPRFSLYVDYGPDETLATAARNAGITSTRCFPWKTSMHISEDRVEVSEGYGAPREIIWQKDK